MSSAVDSPGTAHSATIGPAAETGSARRPRRPVRLSTLVLLLVTATAAVGYVYLDAVRDPVRVYVAARDLPAFHQITEPDVRQAEVEKNKVPADAVRERDALLGRYTIGPLKQDGPFRRVSLGPVLKPSTFRGLSFVAIAASPEVTLGGRLARGDRGDVLLSRTDARAKPGRLKDVLVVDVAKDAVVLGVRVRDAGTLLRARGTSRISIIRVGAYARP